MSRLMRSPVRPQRKWRRDGICLRYKYETKGKAEQQPKVKLCPLRVTRESRTDGIWGRGVCLHGTCSSHCSWGASKDKNTNTEEYKTTFGNKKKFTS